MMLLIVILLVMIVVLLGGGPIIGGIINFLIIVLVVSLGGGWMTVNEYWPHFIFGVVGIITVGGLVLYGISESGKNQKAKTREEYLAKPKEERENVVYGLKTWPMNNRETRLRVIDKLLKKNDASERLKKLGWDPIKLDKEILFAQEGRSSYMPNLGVHDVETLMLELLNSVEEAKIKIDSEQNAGLDAPELTTSESSAESQSMHFVADELKKLSELKEQGILSEEEFNLQKSKLLEAT